MCCIQCCLVVVVVAVVAAVVVVTFNVYISYCFIPCSNSCVSLFAAEYRNTVTVSTQVIIHHSVSILIYHMIAFYFLQQCEISL